jgi:hypothetical protein
MKICLVIIIAIILAVFIRLVLYGVYGPDTGMAIVVSSTSGSQITFFGIMTKKEQLELVDQIAKLVYYKPTDVSGSVLDLSDGDDSILPFYWETSHPCKSFYDSVCGIMDSFGANNNEEEQFLMGEHSMKSSGLFKEVAVFSKKIMDSFINQNVYYKTCNSESDLSWLSWDNIQVPDIPLMTIRNYSIGFYILGKMISKGLHTPLSISVKKIMHLPEYGIEVWLDMLPIMDMTFNVGSGISIDNSRPNTLFDFYSSATLLGANATKTPETIQEYFYSCRNLTSFGLMTKDLLVDIFPNASKVSVICSFEDLDTVVIMLVQAVNQEYLKYWDYFHRLTIYYETLPYFRDDYLFRKKLSLVNIAKKEWILNIFQDLPVCNWSYFLFW